MLKKIILCSVTFNVMILSSALFGQSDPKLSSEDLQFLNGLYTGTLTYTDYTSEEIVTLQLVCNTYLKNDQLAQSILINEWGGNYEQSYTYKVKNGTIDGHQMDQIEIDREKKMIKVVYTRKGQDGNENRPCTFKYTLVGDVHQYSITKQVKFDDETDYFIRNQYRFNRLQEVSSTDLGFKE